MANGDGSKLSFQWVAGVLLSIVLIIAGASLTETRSDIRDVRKASAEVCDRVTILETANKLQFEEIRKWRDETKLSLEKIASTLDSHERNTKSTAAMKKWQDFPESRGNN